MKASKLALCAFLFVFAASFLTCCAVKHDFFSIDMRLRYNEVACSHLGINPFKIWNGEIKSSEYQGLKRPDVPGQGNLPGVKVVHAYPPWHTTFAWFYTLVSEDVAVDVLMSVKLAAIAFLFVLGWRLLSDKPYIKRILTVFVMGVFLYRPFFVDIVNGNYGLVVAFLAVMLFESLEIGNLVASGCLSGCLYSLMMVKPQVAVLFAWPLLWQKRYSTIAIAAMICLLATLWPAYVYGESPLALILQIPKIGAPYVRELGSPILVSHVFRHLSESQSMMWQVVMFCGCGLCCAMLRKSPSWFVRCLPIGIFLPIWTYSSTVDNVVTWYEYLLIGAGCVGCLPWRIGVGGKILFVLATIMMGVRIALKGAWLLPSVLDFIPSQLSVALYNCTYLIQLLTLAASGFYLLYQCRKHVVDGNSSSLFAL